MCDGRGRQNEDECKSLHVHKTDIFERERERTTGLSSFLDLNAQTLQTKQYDTKTREGERERKRMRERKRERGRETK